MLSERVEVAALRFATAKPDSWRCHLKDLSAPTMTDR